MQITLTVNGAEHHVEADPNATLLDVLRDELALTGTKEGCDEGECGSCTVLVDGEPIDSCLLHAGAASGSTIETIEGLRAADGSLTSLQQALLDAGGVQCGFCTPGFVMTLTALLRRNPSPTRDQVREAIAGNICRCTGYSQIVEATLAASGQEVNA